MIYQWFYNFVLQFQFLQASRFFITYTNSFVFYFYFIILFSVLIIDKNKKTKYTTVSEQF